MGKKNLSKRNRRNLSKRNRRNLSKRNRRNLSKRNRRNLSKRNRRNLSKRNKLNSSKNNINRRNKTRHIRNRINYKSLDKNKLKIGDYGGMGCCGNLTKEQQLIRKAKKKLSKIPANKLGTLPRKRDIVNMETAMNAIDRLDARLALGRPESAEQMAKDKKGEVDALMRTLSSKQEEYDIIFPNSRYSNNYKSIELDKNELEEKYQSGKYREYYESVIYLIDRIKTYTNILTNGLSGEQAKRSRDCLRTALQHLPLTDRTEVLGAHN